MLSNNNIYERHSVETEINNEEDHQKHEFKVMQYEQDGWKRCYTYIIKKYKKYEANKHYCIVIKATQLERFHCTYEDNLQQEINKYKKHHPLYYPTVPSLQEKCPVNYDWAICSSSEYGEVCRTCCHYNPLRMLYESDKNGIKIVVPKDVFLDDCRVQLEKG